MRVLHVSPSFYPALMYGGPVMALYQLCLSQLAAGHLVTVLTSDAAGAQRIYQLPTEQLPTEQLPTEQPIPSPAVPNRCTSAPAPALVAGDGRLWSAHLLCSGVAAA
jgi:hypothetical protein